MANTLTWKENKIITNIDIEPTTNILVFCPTFNQIITENTFNNISLTSIYFGTRFNQVLAPFPPNIKKIVFGKNFNKPISENTFPQTLETLIFGEDFYQILNKGYLPSSLKRLNITLANDICDHNLPNLRFFSTYSWKIFYKIPDNVEKVRHNLIIDNTRLFVYPKNMVTLTISDIVITNKIPYTLPPIINLKFESNIICNFINYITFPNSIKKIEINCPIKYHELSSDDFPNTKILVTVPVEYLINYSNLCNKILTTNNGKTTFLLDNDKINRKEICLKWNKGIVLTKYDIHSTINTIIFGPVYNQALVQFPLNIRKIVFGDNFNTLIENNILPHTLHTLIFGNKYNQFLHKGSLPISLRKLHIGSLRNSIDNHGLPNLKFVSIACTYCDYKVPDTVEKIRHDIKLATYECTKFNYPKNIKSLTINNLYIDSNNITTYKYNLPTIGHLKIKKCVNPNIINSFVFPNSIKHIEFINMDNQNIRLLNARKTITQLTVNTIILPDNFNEPVHNGTFPPTLKALFFGNKFNQVLNKGVLPSSLTRLHIGSLRNNIDDHNLPNLRFFSISNCWCIYKIPDTIKKIRHNIELGIYSSSVFNYPKNIKKLTLSNMTMATSSSIKLYELPNITNLRVKNCANLNLINNFIFPNSIKKIEFI